MAEMLASRPRAREVRGARSRDANKALGFEDANKALGMRSRDANKEMRSRDAKPRCEAEMLIKHSASKPRC